MLIYFGFLGFDKGRLISSSFWLLRSQLHTNLVTGEVSILFLGLNNQCNRLVLYKFTPPCVKIYGKLYHKTTTVVY